VEKEKDGVRLNDQPEAVARAGVFDRKGNNETKRNGEDYQ